MWGLWLAVPGAERSRADYWISAHRDQLDFQIDIPSDTTDYHLVQSAPSVSNWGITGLVLGVQGTQTWTSGDVLSRQNMQFYRVFSRDVMHPLDSDGDGIDDVYELRRPLLLNPLAPDDADADGDGDGLSNREEYQLGSDPEAEDSDLDGVTDGAEVHEHGTDPLRADTDGDGLPDGWEIGNGFDPLSDGGATYGLVAHWTFDEGSGAVAANTVSTNWPGLLRNMGEGNWVAGRNGGALEFDGLSEYVGVDQT
ncbi:MAG: hypothetical protein GX548_12495, partial [Lentisphaerae bacterium]|nr:hypothetical protein [Lentisphaerota bacterium]